MFAYSVETYLQFFLWEPSGIYLDLWDSHEILRTPRVKYDSRNKLYIFFWKIIKQFREVLCHLSTTESRVRMHQEPSDHHLFIHLALCRNPHQVRMFSFQSFPSLIYIQTEIEEERQGVSVSIYSQIFIYYIC